VYICVYTEKEMSGGNFADTSHGFSLHAPDLANFKVRPLGLDYAIILNISWYQSDQSAGARVWTSCKVNNIMRVTVSTSNSTFTHISHCYKMHAFYMMHNKKTRQK